MSRLLLYFLVLECNQETVSVIMRRESDVYAFETPSMTYSSFCKG